MALSTDSIRPEPKKAAAKPAEPSGDLTPAGEASDPAVHQLLAEKQTAVANGDDDAVKALDRQLNELGYE